MRTIITDLLAMQGRLDQLVLDNLPDDKLETDLRTERAIAMVCEFLEGADGSLEEQADFLHFILSYALEWGLGADDLMREFRDPSLGPCERTSAQIHKDSCLLLAQLLNLHERDWKFWKKRYRIGTHEQVSKLCSQLMVNCFAHNHMEGRTIDALVGAYIEKNRENVRRQQTGY